MRRLGLVLFMLTVSACQAGRAKPPASAAPGFVNINSYVLDENGRCSVAIDASIYVLDHREGIKYEERLRSAMREMDFAARADLATRQHFAHEVRKAYVKWMKNYYEVGMTLTKGPYRCLSRGYPAEVLSSDQMVEKRALFQAYVTTLAAIPEPTVR